MYRVALAKFTVVLVCQPGADSAYQKLLLKTTKYKVLSLLDYTLLLCFHGDSMHDLNTFRRGNVTEMTDIDLDLDRYISVLWGAGFLK